MITLHVRSCRDCPWNRNAPYGTCRLTGASTTATYGPWTDNRPRVAPGCPLITAPVRVRLNVPGPVVLSDPCDRTDGDAGDEDDHLVPRGAEAAPARR